MYGIDTFRRSLNMQRILAGISLMLSPLVGLAAGTAMGFLGRQGPGDGWVFSHLLFIISFVLLIPAISGLRSLLRVQSSSQEIVADAGITIAIPGILALLGQMTIDLAVGFLATNKAEMSTMFQTIRAVPGMELTFYSLGPVLLYAGIVLFVGLLAYLRKIPMWIAGFTLAGNIFIAIGTIGGTYIDAIGSIAPVFSLGGMVSLCIGLFPLGWNMLIKKEAFTNTGKLVQVA
jgi:hypothetical protein